MAEDLVGFGKAAVRLIETGEKFLERLVGPYLDEKGQSLADGIRVRRHRNAATVAGMAAGMLDGQEPREVPGRVIFPMLEAAANEDDPEMQKVWASLLANSASADDPMMPGYVEMVRQFTPLHARVLDWIYRNTRSLPRKKPDQPAPEPKYVFFMDVSREQVVMAFPEMGLARYHHVAEDLHRHGLLSGGQSQTAIYAEHGPLLSPHFARVRLTQRAHRFMVAANPPGVDLGGSYLPLSEEFERQEYQRLEFGYEPKRKAAKKKGTAKRPGKRR